jgi:hypothetical protein
VATQEGVKAIPSIGTRIQHAWDEKVTNGNLGVIRVRKAKSSTS